MSIGAPTDIYAFTEFSHGHAGFLALFNYGLPLSMRTWVRISNEFSAKENTSNLKFSRNTKTFGKTLIYWCYYFTQRLSWRKYDLYFDAYTFSLQHPFTLYNINYAFNTRDNEETIHPTSSAVLSFPSEILIVPFA